MRPSVIAILFAFAIAAPLSAQTAPPPALSLEHRLLLRCSVVLAVLAREEAQAGASPALAPRAREYFVRAAARVMDETGLDRAALAALLETEARALQSDSLLAELAPVCLAQLPPA